MRGPAAGFDESVFVALAHDSAVSLASPLLELQLSVGPSSLPALRVLGLDPFRAAALQPELMGAIAADIPALFASDAIVLSRAAADALHLQRSDRLSINVGGTLKWLRVIDILPGDGYPQPLGIMDIAAAQWTLERLGRLNRIDLRLRAGSDPRLRARAPGCAAAAGVFALSPQIERGRASAATRAYRVNLDVLALVALLTGAFVVFSTQWLSVLRRRVALGLLRSLGVTRAELRLALLAETAALGALGSALGILLGTLLATLMLHYAGGADLGNRQLAAIGAGLSVHLGPMLAFALIGTAAACAGGACPHGRPRSAHRRSLSRPATPSRICAGLATTAPGMVALGSRCPACLPAADQRLAAARLPFDRCAAARCGAAGTGTDAPHARSRCLAADTSYPTPPSRSSKAVSAHRASVSPRSS